MARPYDCLPGEFALDRFVLPDELRESLGDCIRAAREAADRRDDAEAPGLFQPLSRIADPFEWARKQGLKPLPEWSPKPRGRCLVRVLDPHEVDSYLESIPSVLQGREERQRAYEAVRRIRVAGAWKPTIRAPAGWRGMCCRTSRPCSRTSGP